MQAVTILFNNSDIMLDRVRNILYNDTDLGVFQEEGFEFRKKLERKE